MSVLAEFAVDLIMEGRDDEAKEMIIAEDISNKMLKAVGEVTLLDYLMKFEEYLDDHDINLFDGWEDAEVICQPKVDKFWVTVYLKTPPHCDIRGAKRILNDKEAQNEVKGKKLPDGSHILQFKVLRRLLDAVEQTNKEKAKEIADREIGEED